MHTADSIHIYHSHSQIINSHLPVHASRDNLMPNHMQTADTIAGLLKNLKRLRALALAVPQPDSSIIASASNYTTVFPTEAYTVHATKVSSPSPECPSGGHVPKKYLLVAADAGEAGIIVGNGEIEDFVTVGGIGLDEARFWCGAEGFGGVVEVHRAVA